MSVCVLPYIQYGSYSLDTSIQGKSLFYSFLFKLDFIFYNSLKFTAKLWKRREISYIFPSPPHKLPPPLSTSLTRVVYLLQFINLYWYIIITQSHSESIVHVRFTLVTFYVLEKCIMTCIHQNSIFTVLKILRDLHVHFCPQQSLAT